MAAYRLVAAGDGETRLEPLELAERAWELGPGDFKGMGGSVAGDATRLMYIRLEPGAHPPLHRAPAGLAIVLAGEVIVSASSGDGVRCVPGDGIELAAAPAGGWRIGNRSSVDALIALVQMPPSI